MSRLVETHGVHEPDTVAAMIAATMCATAALAQSERGTISGTVQDATGAVVPGAKVTLTNSQTGVTFSLPSNASGEFTVPQLPVGTYTVKFDKEGFRQAAVTGIVLDASMSVRVDGRLEVGVVECGLARAVWSREHDDDGALVER